MIPRILANAGEENIIKKVGGGNIIGTITAVIVLALRIYLLVRPNKYSENILRTKAAVAYK